MAHSLSVVYFGASPFHLCNDVIDWSKSSTLCSSTFPSSFSFFSSFFYHPGNNNSNKLKTCCISAIGAVPATGRPELLQHSLYCYPNPRDQPKCPTINISGYRRKGVSLFSVRNSIFVSESIVAHIAVKRYITLFASISQSRRGYKFNRHNNGSSSSDNDIIFVCTSLCASNICGK